MVYDQNLEEFEVRNQNIPFYILILFNQRMYKTVQKYVKSTLPKVNPQLHEAEESTD